MGKNKEESLRLQGMQMAYRVAKEKGIEGLEKDIKCRGAWGIPVGLNNSVLDEFVTKVKNTTLDSVLILAMVTLHDEFGFGHDRLQRFQNRFDFKASCFDGDFTNWDEQIAILKDECDIELAIRPNDEDVKIR